MHLRSLNCAMLSRLNLLITSSLTVSIPTLDFMGSCQLSFMILPDRSPLFHFVCDQCVPTFLSLDTYTSNHRMDQSDRLSLDTS